MKILYSLGSLLGLVVFGQAQSPALNDALRLAETFGPGSLYQVNCRVTIAGELHIPADKKGEAAKTLAIHGNSVIDYDERVLLMKDGAVDRSLRLYRKLDFERKVGDLAQQSSLRPQARRLVILRNGPIEVPFSPDVPLTWNELDLVRTDVFTPALAGLLPAAPVRIGDTWNAQALAVRELTDLDRLEDSVLACKLESISTLVGRRQARVAFRGMVKGVGEDGPARHQLEGYFFFDLEGNFLSYLHMKGTHFLLDAAGQSKGKIDGVFTLTRQPLTTSRDLDADAVRNLKLEPGEENTLLLYDNPDLGIRLLHPRRWRMAGANGKQIGLDENRGSGLLITLEAPERMPTAAQYQQEAQTWLSQQKATIHKMEKPAAVAGSNTLDVFRFDAELTRQRVLLDYYLGRQPLGGFMAVARLLPDHRVEVQRDVDRIVRSVEFTKKQ